MSRAFKHPDSFHLKAAEGWLELGNHLEANQELENISPRLRVHRDVLAIRCRIYMKASKWDGCAEVAEVLVKTLPKQSEWWLARSTALHKLQPTQEAYDKLLPVVGNFSEVWRIPYNLSCYASMLGRFPDSERWFKKAILIDDKIVPRVGIDDPDLKPLWDSMSTTIWRRNE